MSNKPVKTFREGTMAASVWERTGRRGQYFELTFSRSFRRANEEGFGYSPCFRERDVEPLKRCIDAAATWIRSQAGEGEVNNSDPEGESVPAVEGAESCEL